MVLIGWRVLRVVHGLFSAFEIRAAETAKQLTRVRGEHHDAMAATYAALRRALATTTCTASAGEGGRVDQRASPDHVSPSDALLAVAAQLAVLEEALAEQRLVAELDGNSRKPAKKRAQRRRRDSLAKTQQWASAGDQEEGSHDGLMRPGRGAAKAWA